MKILKVKRKSTPIGCYLGYISSYYPRLYCMKVSIYLIILGIFKIRLKTYFNTPCYPVVPGARWGFRAATTFINDIYEKPCYVITEVLPRDIIYYRC